MARIISLFNHKGGVGKTTLAYNLGYALAEKNKKVLLVDADPQMNLTSSIYGLATDTQYSSEIQSKWLEYVKNHISIKDIIHVSMQLGEQKLNPKKSLFQSKLSNNLILLSGSLDLPNLESELHTMIRIGGDTLRAIPYRIEMKIREYLKEFDYIIIDMAPSASSIINAILLGLSDYFIAPVSPAFFSMQAIQNLSTIYHNWFSTLLGNSRRSIANPEGLSCEVKFLGVCVQMARRMSGKNNKENTSHAHFEWSQLINDSTKDFIKDRRSVSEDIFKTIFPSKNPYIIQICNDVPGELRSIAERAGKPIIAITQEDCRLFKNKNTRITTDVTNEFLKNKNGKQKKNQHYIAYNLIKEQINFIADGLITLSK